MVQFQASHLSRKPYEIELQTVWELEFEQKNLEPKQTENWVGFSSFLRLGSMTDNINNKIWYI